MIQPPPPKTHYVLYSQVVFNFFIPMESLQNGHRMTLPDTFVLVHWQVKNSTPYSSCEECPGIFVKYLPSFLQGNTSISNYIIVRVRNSLSVIQDNQTTGSERNTG